MKVFNDIRQTLLDPSETGQVRRRELATTSGLIKGFSGLAAAAMTGMAVIGLMAMRQYSLAGGLLTFVSSAGAVAAREVKVISENAETMVSEAGLLRNIADRAAAASSPDNFVARITRNTWVVGPYFNTSIARDLKQC